MKNQFAVLILISSLMLSACQPSAGIINHPKPEMPNINDMSVFENGGCPLDEYGMRYCKPISPVGVFGCTMIFEPPEFIGGLEPWYPIATCHVQMQYMNPGTRAEVEQGKYLYEVYGVLHGYIRYVIYQDGRFVAVKTKEDFQRLYAPVTSPEEALSYVLAMTKLTAYYGLEFKPNFIYNEGSLEDTHVTRTFTGYHLFLFFNDSGGCGEHWVSAVEVNLTRGGEIQETSRKEIFRDKGWEGTCAD